MRTRVLSSSESCAKSTGGGFDGSYITNTDPHYQLSDSCIDYMSHLLTSSTTSTSAGLIGGLKERLVEIALAEVSKRTSLDVKTAASPPRPRRESDDGVIIPGARLAGVTIRVERRGAVEASSVSYPEPTTESIVFRLSNMLADFGF
ncbi:hypothetical protein DFH28DRAFT_933250 [Melampsora americana]|nr:hypothetical protein DFH28DRAFT_933250 [Melampsora americana]